MSFIQNKKIIFIAVPLLIVLGLIGWSASGSKNTETVTVVRDTLVRTVELSGKVVPNNDADLAFEVGGTVSGVYKNVGDTVYAGELLATLDQSGTQAELLKAEADLDIALAELAKLSGGTNLEAKITNSKTSVIQNIVDAYTTASDAVFNKVDQFFEDPRTQNPRILYVFKGLALRDKINLNRISVGEVLSKWKILVDGLTVNTYTPANLSASQAYLKTVASFLDDVSLAVNSFETNPSLTQTTVDKYRTDVATARNNINTAAAVLIAGDKSLTGDVSDVPVQVAKVSSAQATVANYRAKLEKMSLRSPLSGIVSKQDAKVGEAIAPNTVVSAVISSDYKIEAYVPEVSVAGVMVGAKAEVSLDAYGKDTVFNTTITRIEPRETIRDGVSTYKIELAFTTPDSRIRSGMTSNISIETLRKEAVLYIPARALNTVQGVSTVSVKREDGTVGSVTIEAGILDSKGNREIISGLSEGDTVLLNPLP